MATDTLPPDGGKVTDYAVVFGLFPGDPTFYTVVERAPDVAGAPGSPTRVAILPPGKRYYVETFSASQGFLHYRFRHEGFGYDAGEPTSWHRARPVEWTGELPPIPREPLLDLDLAIDLGDGTVDVVIDGGNQVASVIWDWSTAGFPVVETGTAANTDAAGDLTIADAFTLSPDETGYVTVAFYSGPLGSGSFLGSLRASVSYPAGAGIVPTIQELRSESATEGSLDLVVNDPDGLVTQVRYRTKSGTDAWSAWAVDAGPSPYGTWTVLLVAKHISFIEYEVTYTIPAGGGATDIIESSVAYDTDLQPEILSLVAHNGIVYHLGFTWDAEIDYIGDSDVASIRVEGSSAGFPSRAETQAGTINEGRTGTNVLVGTAVSRFFDYYISVLAYTGAGATGTESATLYQVVLKGIASGSTGGDVILNCEFDETTPGEGSYWATTSGSTAVANSETPSVGAGVDFTADADDETITLVQVINVDDDITKPISV